MIVCSASSMVGARPETALGLQASDVDEEKGLDHFRRL
jgi:hypothetical protein